MSSPDAREQTCESETCSGPHDWYSLAGAPASRKMRCPGPAVARSDSEHEYGRKHSRPWCVTHDVPLLCTAFVASVPTNEDEIRSLMQRVDHDVFENWLDTEISERLGR